MDLAILFNASLWATVLTALPVALWLWSKRREEPGLSALAAFCLSMALWCLGHIFALHNQPKLALPLLLANPLLPTTFLHFVIVWLRGTLSLPPSLYRRIPFLYAVALLVTVISMRGEGGFLAPWLMFTSFFHLSPVGWVNLLYTIVVGVFAHLLLLQGFRNSQGNQRRSILVVFAVGAWGFLLATSFILPSIGQDIFPYLMLALPSYAVLVVYSVVRYRLVEANRWVSHAIQWLAVLLASMALMWGFLLLIKPLGLHALTAVPGWQLLLYSGVLLLVAWLLYGPAKNISERLVYPGATIDEETLNTWVGQLNGVTSWQELASTVEAMWLHRGKFTAGLSIINSHGAFMVKTEQVTQFTCLKRAQWHCYLNGWQDITPSQQHMAEVLAALLPSTCASLERSIQLAKVEATAERQRIEQRHLVELGGLTAVIAHELRNPLNIINMASMQTEPEIKTHIQNQVARAELLIRDTLSYANQIELQKIESDLMIMIKQVRGQISELYKVDIELNAPDSLVGLFDVPRLQQVLINILENSAAFINQKSDGKILLEIKPLTKNSGLVIAIHNNGPAIPPEEQAHLFEPFISKRSGGSGLGLSIVRRIVDAHDGQVEYRQDSGWPVSFIVTLPQDRV